MCSLSVFSLAEQAVAKERLEEDMRGVKEELENK